MVGSSAITSSIQPNDHIRVEPARYDAGSVFKGLLATVMTDGDGRMPRALKWIGQILRLPLIAVHGRAAS